MSIQEFKKRRVHFEDNDSLGFTQSRTLSDIVFILEEENRYLRLHINKIYPNLKYSVINFGTKHDIYKKEIEDLSYDFIHTDKNTGVNCYNTDFIEIYNGNPLFIDGNKLIIYGNWDNGINDEIVFLILNYQIDIVIIKDMCWNNPIDKLPNRITSIKIYSDYFDQPVKNLPSELKILVIKSGGIDSHGVFNKPINNLPNSLEDLVIYSDNFDRPVNQLPNNLSKLYIGGKNSNFHHPVDNLPSGLQILCICSEDFNQSLSFLPESLKLLFVEFHIENPDILENLPQGLEILYYGFYAGFAHNYTVNNLPNSLRELHLGSSFNNSIDSLPDSIEILCIGDESNYFNTAINKLPRNLSCLYITVLTSFIDSNGFTCVNNESVKLTMDIFANCDIEKLKQVSVKNIERILNWKQIGFQLSCDI